MQLDLESAQVAAQKRLFRRRPPEGGANVVAAGRIGVGVLPTPALNAWQIGMLAPEVLAQLNRNSPPKSSEKIIR